MRLEKDVRDQALTKLRSFRSALASSRVSVKLRSIRGRICPRLFSGDEGQSLIEFALILPMLVVAITGVLIFGIYEMQMQSLTEGVSAAGRALMVSAGNITDPCATTITTIRNASPVLNPSNLSYVLTLNPITPYSAANNHTYSGTFIGTTCNSASATTGAAGNLVSNGTVQVTATFNACSLKFYGNNLTPGGCSISQSITEVVQ
jgi:Flp pilus assembly protein TadG